MSNDIICPYCDTKLDTFKDSLINKLNKDAIFLINQTMIHDLRKIEIENLKSIIKKIKEINVRSSLIDELEDTVNGILKYQSTTIELIKNLDYCEDVITLKELINKVLWLSRAFNHENIFENQIKNLEIKTIKFEKYWNIFFYGFHCLNLTIRRVIEPKILIKVREYNSKICTEFKVNRNVYENDIKQIWTIFLGMCQSLNVEAKVKISSSQSTINWEYELLKAI